MERALVHGRVVKEPWSFLKFTCCNNHCNLPCLLFITSKMLWFAIYEMADGAQRGKSASHTTFQEHG